MSEIVDRKADTKETEDEEMEVNRVGPTQELLEEPEVDRDASTQEPADDTRLTFHVHPTEKQSLLKGLPNEPQKFILGKSIIFGRGEDVDVFLNDQFASKRHLELTFELHQPTQQGLFKVKNIGKKLFVNGSTLITGDDHYLRPNDVIQMGQLTFTTEIVGGNDNLSYIVEFKKGSQGPNLVQVPQNQPGYQVPQSPPQINPFYFPGQVTQPYPYTTNPNQVQQPQPQLPGYHGAAPVPVAAYPPPFPLAKQPILPTGGPYSGSYPAHEQHSSPYEQADTTARREAFQSGGRSASENEDTGSPKLSVEETQPPKLESLGESLEDTNSPKQ